MFHMSLPSFMGLFWTVRLPDVDNDLRSVVGMLSGLAREILGREKTPFRNVTFSRNERMCCIL